MSAFPIRTRLGVWMLALGLVQGAAADPIPAKDVQEVHAEFVSAAGDSGVQSVRLFVDGQDVSSSARAGKVRVGYTPTENLSPGTHSARVVVVDSLGRAFEKEWTFEVADEPAEVVLFFSTALDVELDPLPRSVRASRLRVSGVTQPGVEVAVRVDQGETTRVMTDQGGRFVAHVELGLGENRLSVAASRPSTGEDGPELEKRVELLAAREQDDPKDVVVAPPRPGAEAPIADGVTSPDVAPGSPVFTPPGPPAERERAGAGDPVGREIERPDVAPIDLVIEPPAPPAQRPRPRDESVASHVAVPDVSPVEIELPPAAEVVITKPNDGEELNASHVTVLGRAPAGWRVRVSVDDVAAGSDVANPSGHFTVPRVEVGPGEHEIVAEATSADGERSARSEPVSVVGPSSVAAQVSILLPARTSSVVREGTLRVEGMAWDGAEVEVEVNGRVVANDYAMPSGRFALDVPLEPGSNLVAVETHDTDGSRWTRSDTYFVTAPVARRVPARMAEPLVRRGAPARAPVADGVVRPRTR